MMKPDELERAIQKLDKQLAELLGQREALVKQFGSADCVDAVDGPRLLEQRLSAVTADGELPTETLRPVFREIVSGELATRRALNVSFFGKVASHTHAAMISKFGSQVVANGRPSIPDVFDDVEKGRADYGVVPVENSSHGAVTLTFDMFADSSVGICAEISQQIHHNLLSNAHLSEIRTVYSHPQALAQCRHWLEQNIPNADVVEESNTANAAERVKSEAAAAAIAGALAAEIYDLPIVQRNIEDLSFNTTRFLVLGREQQPPTGDDKTSLVLVLKDRVGALHDALLPFRNHGLNLSLIESRPSRQKSWQYYFYVDYFGHRDDEKSAKVMAELADCCQTIKILGSYPRVAE